MMEVENVSEGLIETNIDPHVQVEESTTGKIEELVEIQVNLKEPSRGWQMSKRWVVPKLADFLCENQDVFS